MLKKNIANCFTVLRIICTITMLFLETLSLPFLIVYTVAGLSDVIDGYLARKLKIESEFGRKMDSIADLLLYVVFFLKIFHNLEEALPAWGVVFIWIIVAVRSINYLYVFLKHHEFSAVHTTLNRLTGVVLFVLPYLLKTKTIVVYAVFACTLALLSASHELYLNISDYDFKH